MLKTIIIVCIISILLAIPIRGENLLELDCGETPCGPFVCQSRCIASCLDTSLANSIQECKDKLCQDFDDNKPCPSNDTVCWKNCGQEGSNEELGPPSVDELRLSRNDDSSNSNQDTKQVRVEWSEMNDASLYLVEVFPMFEGQSIAYNQFLIRNLTKDTSLTFERQDQCDVYMVRLMVVNGFGISTARYLIIDSWKPELNADDNFDVRYIRREGDLIKVFIQFTPPDKWTPESAVVLDNSFVRAHDCVGEMDETAFTSSDNEQAGVYTPMVFINETDGNGIELDFPAKIMKSKCLFSYRVSELRSRCNLTTQLDDVGIDFSINCLSVENSACQSEETSHEESELPQATIESSSNDDDSIKSNTTSDNISPPDDDEKQDSAETTTPTAHNSEEDSESNIQTTTQTGWDSHEEQHPNDQPTSPLPEYPNEDSESDTTTLITPSDFIDATNLPEVPPVIVAIEPHDPRSPICKVNDFDATAVVEGDGDDRKLSLTIAWTEFKPDGSNLPFPSHFLVRYGPIQRSLVVDQQPDIIDETILRTERAQQLPDVAEALSRSTKIDGLIAGTLYAFQICTIYQRDGDSAVAWDTAPKYTIDLSAIEDNKQSIVATTSIDIDPMIDTSNSTNLDAIDNSMNDFETTTPAAIDDSVQQTDTDDIVIILPEQPPTILNVDVKPVVVSDQSSSSWASMHALWFMIFFGFAAVIVGAIVGVISRRNRRRNKQFKTEQPFQVNPTLQEVKVPLP